MYDPNVKLNVNTKGLYRNRTARYFAPILRSFGESFVKQMNKLPIKAFAIGDLVYSDSLTDYIYCIVSTSRVQQLNEVLSFLNKQTYYVDNYMFSIENGLHCIVFTNPRPNAVNKFLDGSYSQMFSEGDIDRFFLKTVTINGVERYTDVYSILTKRIEYDNVFLERINKDFNSSLTEIENGMEYDYPPIIGEEVLNTEEESVLDLMLQQQSIFDNLTKQEWKQ